MFTKKKKRRKLRGRVAITPTGHARTFAEHEVIVSKTDPKGVITYANELFYQLADYTQDDIIGTPHNVIRHPDMPKCVFKLLWDRLKAGKEIFAYVVNMSKNGDHYWVFAHVTPTFDNDGNIIGYHSNRRAPKPESVKQIQSLYHTLLDEERKHTDSRTAIDASYNKLLAALEGQGISYDEFILSL